MELHLKVKVMTLAQEARIIKRLARSRLNKARDLRTRLVLDEARGAFAEFGPNTRSEMLSWREGHLNEYHSLHHHRVQVVRPAARAAGLALAFMRGYLYRTIENDRTKTAPRWDEVIKNVARFTGRPHSECKDLVESWHKGGAGLVVRPGQ